MDEPISLAAERTKRDVESLVQQALEAPPLPNDIDLSRLTLKCDGHVSGTGDVCEQRLIMFDISTGVGIVVGALTVNPEQWTMIKNHVDLMFSAYQNRPK